MKWLTRMRMSEDGKALEVLLSRSGWTVVNHHTNPAAKTSILWHHESRTQLQLTLHFTGYYSLTLVAGQRLRATDEQILLPMAQAIARAAEAERNELTSARLKHYASK